MPISIARLAPLSYPFVPHVGEMRPPAFKVGQGKRILNYSGVKNTRLSGVPPNVLTDGLAKEPVALLLASLNAENKERVRMDA